MTAIDKQMAAALQMPAEHGKFRQRFFRDDPKLKRQRPEQNRRVVDALMVRHEHVRSAGRYPFETFDRYTDAGRLEYQKRPRAGASVREVAVAIPQARDD